MIKKVLIPSDPIENDKLTIICGFGFGPGKTYAKKYPQRICAS